MRRRIAFMTSFLLAAGIAIAGPAAADEPDGVYVSLGDSVAAGTQANEVVTDDSYTDVLYARLRDDLGLGQHVKLGCPGESSTTFISGGCPGAAAIGGYTTGKQLDDALAAIATAGADLKLITINLGANDVLPCVGAPDVFLCVGAALGVLQANLVTILSQIKAVAPPGVPIVAMNYYNPLLAWVLDDAQAPMPGLGPLSQVLVSNLNAVLEGVYGAPGIGVPVADVAAAFHTFDEGRNVDYVCRYTLMCERSADSLVMSDWNDLVAGPQPDIHPTDIGHRKIAWAFMEEI